MQQHWLFLILNLNVFFAPLANAQDTAAVDRIMLAYSGNRPGASLLVIHDGAIILQRNYGYANREAEHPVRPTSNFRLASVTKQFTATCILQLINRGVLSLSTTLTDTFPGFPAYGQQVTVEHLLTHTSGIPDYEDYVADTTFHPQVRDHGVLDILMHLNRGYFTPGTQFRYSNSGYALLALMVERYSGKRFADYLSEEIFSPLGMSATVAHEDGVSIVAERAFGYSSEAGTWIRKDQSSTSAVLGDGGIYSNVLDLYKWDQALYSSRLLPQDLIEKCFGSYRLSDGSPIPYGYGWHLKRSQRGDLVVYHTGSSTSFRNIFYRIPSKRFSIILLTNRNEPEEADMCLLAEQIAAVCLGLH